MGILSNNPYLALGNPGTGYQIQQSLRFNSGDSPYLVKTFSSSPTSSTTQTFSWWVKLLNTDAANQFPGIYGRNGSIEAGFSYRNTGDATNPSGFRVENGTSQIRTSAVYRDFSAWMHCVMVFDTDNATSADRIRLYVNGERVTDFAAESQPGSGATVALLSTNANGNLIGSYATNSNFSDFYLAEFHGVDGQALTHEDFGEYDESGVWRPIAYTGSHGTNGFYLTFDPSATNGIGHDHSGNGNNFTPTNFTTSGTGTDVMSDTPTSNFATLNPLIGHDPGGRLAPTYSNGNLTVAPQVDASNNSRVASATLARNPADGGVWRWEMVVNNNNNAFYGIMAIDEDYGQGDFGPYWAASGLGGNLSTSGGASGSLQEQHATISAGDVIGIVVSFNDNEIGWYINGTRDGFYNGCNFSNYTQLVPFCKESTRTQTPCTFDVNFGRS